MDNIRRFFAAPVFKDEEKTRAAGIINTILISISALAIISLVGVLFSGQDTPPVQYIAVISLIVVFLGLKFPLHSGYVTVVSIIIVAALTILITVVIISGGTVRAPAISILILASVIAGLTLGRNAAYWSSALNILIVTAVVYGEMNGLLRVPNFQVNFQQALIFSVSAIMTVILVNQALGRIQVAVNELTKLNVGLEERVAARTKALATSTEVSRRLSTILDRKELVAEVVNQVKNAFGYYHAQIYFFDEAKENLVMAGGTGEAGEMMLAQSHQIAKGRGLVGSAAESNQIVLVSDTLQNPEWLPNALLPDTRSEIAIPISIGDQVLGVLDIQHNVTDGLQREDVDSLQSIANQVAIALQNIQSTEVVAKRATELQTVANISTAAATIINIEDMLQEVVHLTQRGFGLYHAHVFTYNENTHALDIIACGYKEGDEHEGTHGTTSIPLEQEHSLVARAGRTRQAVIVNDVRSDPGWLPNPILTETAAELAVPMIVGNQLLGVLDVQSERLNAFTEEDASIQTTLASQVATALQNARFFAEAQRQAERETTVNLITQKIQSTTSIESALQMAARELGHALGMKPTLVTLEPKPRAEPAAVESESSKLHNASQP